MCRLPKKSGRNGRFFFSPAGRYSLPLSSRSPSLVKKSGRKRPLFLLARRTLFASLVLAMGELLADTG